MRERVTIIWATVISVTALILVLVWPLTAFAHGSHGFAGTADGVPYIPPEGAGWFEIVYELIQREIKSLLKLVNEGERLGPALSILVLAFGYGVVHAVGPGHGKMLLASYMAATRASAGIGIVIAIVAAAIQGLIAILVVLLLAVGMQALAHGVPALQGYASKVSLALLAMFGLTIMFRQLAALKFLPTQLARHAPQSTCGCCSSHEAPHSHDHDAHRAGACAPQDRSQFLEAVALAVSMGARPCTSAFAILLLALAQGVLWLGILATVVMALGVAATLAVIAVVSASMRDRAHSSQSRWISERTIGFVSLGAGSLLAMLAIGGLVTA